MKLSIELAAAIDAAKKAGNYILERSKGEFDIAEKLSPLDFVTDVDKESERMIRDDLQLDFPNYGFIGEEDDQDENEIKHYLTNMPKGESCWIVDPLDGTVNFVRNVPGFCVSIGLARDSETVAGVIYIPHYDELFYTEKGKGAWLNGKQIYVSDKMHLSDAFLATGIPAIDLEYRRQAMVSFKEIALQSLNIRMLGSAARAIAYVACGRFDGYWDIGPHPWDMAAGMLLLREAGGRMSNYNGEEYTYKDDRLIATNGKIHKELESIVTNIK